ncbi:hypothetical protein CA13_64650 [Planctomycetes bacterium CA13]|uniref:Uncharacterized protein n=1 Tax=Novipirellula herctigrandis TaxID=2527986 RepID=A0A5C5ZEL6_9BACT|nr:hypothetical protein CA13_64650 [Planctomycetes bacterium CA13]
MHIFSILLHFDQIPGYSTPHGVTLGLISDLWKSSLKWGGGTDRVLGTRGLSIDGSRPTGSRSTGSWPNRLAFAKGTIEHDVLC